jgi:hypothetical protein
LVFAIRLAWAVVSGATAQDAKASNLTCTLLWKPLSGVVSAGYIFRAPETGKAAAFLVNGLLTMKQESPG